MKFACKAATRGNARCRNMVSDLGGLCSTHSEVPSLVVSDQPDVVLYKTNVNKNWSKRLKELGVQLKNPDFEAKEKKHIDHAKRFGREPFKFRGEIADSGVPVFGKDGLKEVSLYELLQELSTIYNVVDIHLRPTKPGGNPHMEVLVVSFSDGEEFVGNTDAFQELMRFLASSCWGHVHVWANPPQDDGRIIHTVNSAHRQDGAQPKQFVGFDDGRWDVQPVKVLVV